MILRTRTRGVLTAVLLVFGVLALEPRPANAVVVFGDPSCDGFGNCTIGNISPSTVGSIDSEVFEVVLRDLQSIGISNSVGVQMGAFFGVGNPGPAAVGIQFGFAYTDGSGNPVGQSFTIPGPFPLCAGGGCGIGNPIYSSAAPPSDFEFRGFQISITCFGCQPGQLNMGDITLIELETINGEASVVPAPEPATLALLGIGLAGIGFSRRRKHWLLPPVTLRDPCAVRRIRTH